LTPFFFQCSTIGIAITAVDCGMRNDHAPRPSGRFTGESMSCTVLPSAATSAIAAATGVATEPTMTSTLSSLMNFLVFLTAVVGSVASSRTMTLSFSPPISFGQRAMPFLVGMPSAEVGPVSEMLTPIVRSASAGKRRERGEGGGSGGREDAILLHGMSPEVGIEMERHSQRARMSSGSAWREGVGVVGVAAHEGARLAPLADEGVAARHAVVLHEHLGAPLLDVGRDRQLLA
jgi:hypothetical protein